MSQHEKRLEPISSTEVPSWARVIALFGDEGSVQSASSAIEFAKTLGGERPHVLLANAATDAETLDTMFGVESGSGFGDVLEGRATIPEIATRGTDGTFVYLPAGRPAPHADDLLGRPRFGTLVTRLRSSGGTLLLYLSNDRTHPGLEALADGFIRLPPPSHAAEGDAVDVASRTAGLGDRVPPVNGDGAELAAPTDVLAGPGAAATTDRLREAARRAVPGREERAKWRRHRSGSTFPVRRVVVALLGVGALVAGWWALSTNMLSRTAPAPTTETGTENDAVEAGVAGAAVAVEPGSARQNWEATIGSAPELPFSVLLASYADWEDAIERRDDLVALGTRVYYIAPTPLGGALYYRVFAGATGDREAATALMEELVELGRKEAASDWDVRPVGLAFALGVYPTRVEAEAFQLRLEQQRIPAYTLPVTAAGDTAFQVYAGGFESEDAAAALAAQLEDAGWEAELVPRRGVER